MTIRDLMLTVYTLEIVRWSVGIVGPIVALAGMGRVVNRMPWMIQERI